MLAVKKQYKSNMVIKRTDKKLKGNFTQIDNNIITNTLLSAGARVVLIYILSLKEESMKLNQSQIANKCGFSERAVNNYVRELKKYGYIKIEEGNYKGNYYSNYLVTEETTVLPSAKFAGTPSAKNASKPYANFAVGDDKSKTIESITNTGFEDKKENLEPVRKFCGHNNTIYNTNNNTEKTVIKNSEIKQISGLTEKQKIYVTYKNLRKNDSQYLELLKEICKENPEELLKDWLDARPFLETQGNIPYFILNSIQNKRSLPEGYIAHKNQKNRESLLIEWGDKYTKITGQKINISTIETSLASFCGSFIERIKKLRSYHSDISDKKYNQAVIDSVKAVKEGLTKTLNTMTLKELKELVSKFLKDERLKRFDGSLYKINPKEVDSILQSIDTLSHQLEKEVGI